jgi:hypothetical protein
VRGYAPDPVLKQKKKQKSGKAFSFSIDFAHAAIAGDTLLASHIGQRCIKNPSKKSQKIR